MSGISRYRRGKKGIMQGWLLWFALTAAFSLMGVGMAAWDSGMDVGGEMGTAHIGVEFTNQFGRSIITNPTDGLGDPPASASIDRKSAKELEIEISNAYLGLQVAFWYQIENTGSLPVRLKDFDFNLPEGFSLYNGSTPPASIGVNNVETGNLYIQVDSAEPDALYTFYIEIVYEPDL